MGDLHESVCKRGEKVALSPCLFAMLYMVSLVNTSASAASSGGSGPVTTSYCSPISTDVYVLEENH